MWEKSGFLFQVSKDHYLLGHGPFKLRNRPDPNTWTLFHAPFFLSSTDSYWYQPVQVKHFSKSQLKSFLIKLGFNQAFLTQLNWKEPSFKKFKEVFKIIKQKINTHHIQKVVPVFFETADYTFNPNELPSLLYHFVFCLPGLAYAFWSESRVLIGSTPEFLFKKNGLQVKTHALAGTAQTHSHDILKDPKERSEHLLVVQDIKKSLKDLGELLISDTYVDCLKNLYHLRTDFQLQLKVDQSFNQLCLLLHPTPALGGTPRSQALSLLHDLQTICGLRHYFGSPFGVSFGKLSICVVAIRNIQFIDDKAYIGSGCGVVQASQLKSEWNELRIKREFVKGV